MLAQLAPETQPNAMHEKIPSLFFALPAVFVLVGACLTAWHIRGFVSAFLASSWPSAAGIIKSCEITEPKGQRVLVHEVIVTYQYEVGGQKLIGSRIHPTYPAYTSDSNYDSHSDLARRLSPGTSVRVLYSPSDPSRSYLATGFVSASFLPVVIGLIFLGGGVGFGLLFWLVNFGSHDYARLIK